MNLLIILDSMIWTMGLKKKNLSEWIPCILPNKWGQSPLGKKNTILSKNSNSDTQMEPDLR